MSGSARRASGSLPPCATAWPAHGRGSTTCRRRWRRVCAPPRSSTRRSWCGRDRSRSSAGRRQLPPGRRLVRDRDGSRVRGSIADHVARRVGAADRIRAHRPAAVLDARRRADQSIAGARIRRRTADLAMQLRSGARALPPRARCTTTPTTAAPRWSRPAPTIARDARRAIAGARSRAERAAATPPRGRCTVVALGELTQTLHDRIAATVMTTSIARRSFPR